MKSISLSNLYSSVSAVSTEAVLNQLQVKNPALRDYLQQNFNQRFGEGAGFLSDPLIESTFGWASAGGKQGENSMNDLAKQGILSPTLVKVMDQAPVHPCWKAKDQEQGIQRVEYDEQITEDEDSRWPADRAPYTHQLEAWKILGQAAPKSAVVTAGTGSGKSECFMVPMLNDMARQVDEHQVPLVGVQAIMLYPLNALINSQRDRLIGWTRGFKGNVRFALYNGETPEAISSGGSENQKFARGEPKPEEVADRKTIRSNPPPILVTNATMLEYMLVRPNDRPILEKSKGKLRWIVLDEAHTLIGSAAAETSLLLRRTMYSFGVEPKDVRIVATSATIGDASNPTETDLKLRAFLSDLAGVDIEQISVVRGHRHVPELPDYKGDSTELSIEKLSMLDSGQAYSTFSQMRLMRNLRTQLVKGPMTLGEIAKLINPSNGESVVSSHNKHDMLRLIDIASDAYPDGNTKKDAFLPFRAHLFHRAQRGLWGCVNPECSGIVESKLTEGWPFGKVFFTDKVNCDCCGYPVFELTHCAKCNEPSLSGVRYISDDGAMSFKPRDLTELDEFSDEVENTEGFNSNSAEAPKSETRDKNVQIYTDRSAIDDRHKELGGSTEAYIKSKNGEISHTASEGLKVFYTIAHDQSDLRCACCNTAEKQEGKVFKRAILGSPFLMGNIVPEMLRHVPTDSPTDMAGRRLITFTDSRQGTARFSARLQLDAERRWTRSVVYRHILGKGPEKSELSDADLASIEQFEQVKKTNPALVGFADEQIANLRSKSQGQSKPVLWNDLVDLLAESSEIRLLSNTGQYQEDQLAGEYADREQIFDSAKPLARLFLLREFARRPLNSNNLESLGLVKTSYPKLQELTESAARERIKVWFNFGFNFEQWKTFLKIFLDFYVREETIIDLKPSEKNWMGAQLFARLLQPQNYVFSKDPLVKAEQQAAYKVVPSARETRPHRLVRLLEIASNRTTANEAGHFDAILNAAFHTLKDLGILEWAEFEERQVHNAKEKFSFKRTGYQLRFESLAFELIDTAYLCPITHRWLDTTMQGPALAGTSGITPITTGNLQMADVKIQHDPVKVPRPDKALLRLDVDSVFKLSQWLSSSEEIQVLRSEGLWRDLNDAAIKHPSLIRSREHSAQQGSENLKLFEKAFKNDALNVLNCSTTMEMGVDIGSLSMVAMNNAPPSTANYLQRAGRAGRRGQSTSVVLTFCKATPHGERIFADPRWPFSPTPVPKVALDSAVIVRRHVNAYFLAQFLITTFESDNLTVSKAGDFFLSEYEFTKAEFFASWLDELSDDTHQPLLAGLRSLVKRTALESLSVQSIIQSVQEQIKVVGIYWQERYEALVQVLEDADKKVAVNEEGKKVVDSAYLRLERQLDGMKAEHLLGLLANRGFLPGYGFPTNVVELVTNNRVEAKKIRESKQWKSPDYPSRSLESAIREYEPGKDVVLNGAVYRSAGLQLSWKVPESEYEVAKLQTMRFVGYCNCGFHTSNHNSFNSIPYRCPECTSPLKKMEYIIPTGFQVDYNAPLHNDYTRPEYGKFKAPLVTIDEADWQALGKLDYGRFRATQMGNVFHFNDGLGAGFAFCWHCGKTHTIEAWPDHQGKVVITEPELKRILKPHPRLQGTKKNGERNCPSEAWSMKFGKINKVSETMDIPVVLGFGTTTTMLELQIRNPDAHKWMTDKTLGTSLATAMRLSFCEMEGISDSELGISIQGRSSPEGNPATSIFIFDKASQGAGYATQLAEKLPQVLTAAYKFAKSCTGACDKACHACLLDFETQHQISNLDRHEIIKFFEQTRLLERLEVPVERRYFGSSTRAELLNAQSLLSLKGTRAKEIDVFVSASKWEIGSHPVLKKLKYLSSQKVRLLFADNVTESIDAELAWQLQRTIDSDVTVESFQRPSELPKNAFPVLRLLINGEELWYVTDDPESLSLDANWGMTEDQCLVTNNGFKVSLVTSPLDLSAKAAQSSLVSNIGLIEDVSRISNLHISKFGEAFVDLIIQTTPSLASAFSSGIERVIYRDRYLMSPITILMVAEIFRELKHRFGRFSAEIETSYAEPNGKYPNCFADDFQSKDDWEEFLGGVMDAIGLTIFTEFLEKRDIPHGRGLSIQTKGGGSYRLLFDQGMGHWSYRYLYNRTRFDFREPRAQGEAYQKADLTVREGNGGTYIVIHEIV
ncbi:MAG: DUF1998 domain-containing protein [Limnobacter sp.]|uniref:DEAD/DEAH box helicase n=1 Tax=Limnobacter sp. TaxID=2003368 RepID=UPI0022C49F8A|nr:DEAD/DEAH box helicase [Limnobacter sp.]MCZ8016223.1 DUF1998 domain-containing protein [Limnobacter sp.]